MTTHSSSPLPAEEGGRPADAARSQAHESLTAIWLAAHSAGRTSPNLTDTLILGRRAIDALALDFDARCDAASVVGDASEGEADALLQEARDVLRALNERDGMWSDPALMHLYDKIVAALARPGVSTKEALVVRSLDLLRQWSDDAIRLAHSDDAGDRGHLHRVLDRIYRRTVELTDFVGADPVASNGEAETPEEFLSTLLTYAVRKEVYVDKKDLARVLASLRSTRAALAEAQQRLKECSCSTRPAGAVRTGEADPG